MQLTTLDNVLWAASFIGHVALFSILMLRRRWRVFPIFTLFIAYHVVQTVVLFVAYRYGSKHSYSAIYWPMMAGAFILQLGWLYEIAREVLRPTGTWVRDSRVQFLFWSGVGILAALASAWAIKPIKSSELSALEMRGFFFSSLLICEIFLVMSVATNRLGLQWRNHVMALAHGLTPVALTSLISDITYVTYGWGRYFLVIDHIRIFVYIGALIYWGVAFWFPERERAPLSPEMREYLVALHNRVQYDLDRLAVKKKTTP